MKRIISIALLLATTLAFTSCEKSETDEPQVDPNGKPAPTPSGISVTKEVDLGLSVKWAGYNIGATSPEETGNFYSWGETSTKSNYTASTYRYYQDGDYIEIGSDISGSSYDIATTMWGGEWRMPTYDELNELYDKCTWTWIEYEGINGYKVTGPNGNSIFLPAAGNKDGVNHYSGNVYGFYWSGTADPDGGYSCMLIFTGVEGMEYFGKSTQYNLRYYGCPVRAVKGAMPERDLGISTSMEVDLGLSVMWSGYNLGATSPEQFGDYYAWGELETKDNYTSSTYNFNYRGWQNISGTTRDIVCQQMGGEWHIPTYAELRELVDNCTAEAVTYKGVKGFKITGPNGNSIFLPAAGYKKGTSLYAKALHGYYWTGSSDGNANIKIHNLYTTGTPHDVLYYYGLPIRPVKGLLPSQATSEEIDIFSSLEKDEMVYVKGGTFTMGATSEQVGEADSDESPAHQVTLGDYCIGKYEVTQGLWEAVMKYSGTCADGSSMSAYSSDVWLGSDPTSGCGLGSDYPAYYVSWEDIVNVFIPRLNKITGKTFRLPTEAEWEFAARGGNNSRGCKYSGGNTIGDVAWYSGNASSTTHPVGTKSPNELGLYDMSGNVWEWCSDWYGSYPSSSQTNPTGPSSGSSRVSRGGSWSSTARDCRVSFRFYSNPEFRYYYLGFRLACGL